MASHNEQIKQLVDDLKSICANNGLGGTANEQEIVTQSFLYKFLNDKFLYEVAKIKPALVKNGNIAHEDLKALSESEYQLLLMRIGNTSAHLKPEHLLSYLFGQQDQSDFYKTFDDVLNDIAITNTAIFSVHTDEHTDIKLFEEELIGRSVKDQSKRNGVAKSLINTLANFKFDEVFSEGFDFFSTLFEYMIKDYNKDGGGKYAEYYTPHSVAKIMAEILVGDSKPSNVVAYDPSAGSGTLLMNIASKIGTERCTIYSQDISQKSSNLLRLNLILNNLSHSINNIVQGNTILHPKHIEKTKMDFIVSNPPFKLDFSQRRNDIETLPNATERFFAGVPNIPNKDKDKMAIYLLFLQHSIFSLKDTGKAAVVVPTGFITAQSGIEKAIRQKLVEKKWLKGVVSMPSNIFATTGTNVSVVFIDKANKEKVVLVDASKLGKKIKEGKNQKTLLSSSEEQQIIDAFKPSVVGTVSKGKTKKKTIQPIPDFSVVLDYDEIAAKNYSFSAGQYFEIKIEYSNITPEEFEEKLAGHQKNLQAMFEEGKELEKTILENLANLHFNGENP
ncbi:MAG: type I restriction-modification system subunit M [Candidatus Peribacteria bacterium]|jgi:type I restriction enzyme M protein|nr:type I restriction-modification system subunit M [Candidatus Peribacteria bacterium]